MQRPLQLRGGCSGGGSGSGPVIPRGAVVFWSTHLAHCCDPALLPRTLAPEPGPGSSWFRRLSVVSPWAAACDMATTRRERVSVAVAVDTAAGRRAVAQGSVGPSGLPAHLDYQSRFEEAFRPERWLREETRPKQWVAFGGGGHLCLGQHVALAEVIVRTEDTLRRRDERGGRGRLNLRVDVAEAARWILGGFNKWRTHEKMGREGLDAETY